MSAHLLKRLTTPEWLRRGLGSRRRIELLFGVMAGLVPTVRVSPLFYPPPHAAGGKEGGARKTRMPAANPGMTLERFIRLMERPPDNFPASQ